MDLPDVNVLLALGLRAHVHHESAQRWLERTAGFATVPTTEVGLVRLATNPVVAGPMASAESALSTLRSIRSHERSTFLPDDTSLAEPHVDLAGLVGHRQVTDLHLLNLAARHDARLVTFDARLAPTLQPPDRHRVLTLV